MFFDIPFTSELSIQNPASVIALGIQNLQYAIILTYIIYCIILHKFTNSYQFVLNIHIVQSSFISKWKTLSDRMFDFMLKSPITAQYLREVKSTAKAVLTQPSYTRQQFLQSMLNPIAASKAEWATSIDILTALNRKKYTFYEIHRALLDREIIKDNIKIYIPDQHKYVKEMVIFELITSSTVQSSNLVQNTKLYVLENDESRDVMGHTRQPHYDCKLEWQSKYGHKTHAFDIKSGKLEVKGMSHIYMPMMTDSGQLDGVLNKITSVNQFRQFKVKQTSDIIKRLHSNDQYKGEVKAEFEHFEQILSDPTLDFQRVNEANLRILEIIPENRRFNPELVFPKPQHLSEEPLKKSTLQKYCGTRINNLRDRNKFTGNVLKEETPELIENLERMDKSWAQTFLNEISDDVFQ